MPMVDQSMKKENEKERKRIRESDLNKRGRQRAVADKKENACACAEPYKIAVLSPILQSSVQSVKKSTVIGQTFKQEIRKKEKKSRTRD